MGRIASILGEDVLELVPKKALVPFIREEEQGFYSVIGNDGSGEVSMLNKTSMEILDLCDGERSVRDIANDLCSRYPNIAIDRIVQDVLDAFSKFEDIGVTTYAASKQSRVASFPLECPSFLYGDASGFLHLATENDYPIILEYLNSIRNRSVSEVNESRIDYVYGNVEQNACQVFLRRELFSFSSDYFLISDRGTPKVVSSLKGMVKVEYSSDAMRNGAFLTLIDMEEVMLRPIVSCIESFYSTYAIRNVSSLRINILPSSSDAPTLAKSLLKAGFSLESIQNGEYGQKSMDLAVFVYYFGDFDGNDTGKQ